MLHKSRLTNLIIMVFFNGNEISQYFLGVIFFHNFSRVILNYFLFYCDDFTNPPGKTYAKISSLGLEIGKSVQWGVTFFICSMCVV